MYNCNDYNMLIQKANKRRILRRNEGGRKIANYLIDKYKGTYRIKAPYNLATNQFSRKLDGTYEDIDCYIECDKGVKIFSLGRGMLQAYIPSLKQGRNILRSIYRDHINKDNTNTTVISYEVERDGKTITVSKENISIIDKKLFVEEVKNSNIISHVVETDEEVIFNFNSKYMSDLEPYLKPRTNGADISPFSSRNLPKDKSYKIPDEDQVEYKTIVEKIGKKNVITLTHTTNAYIKSLVNKKNTWENIKADMAKKGLSGKTYIHSIGKWSDYISYLHKELGV